MKFFFLLCATLFVATSLFGQEYEIPKKATTIIVKTGLDKDENFSLIGEKLIENQVLLDKVEEAFGLVTTEPVQKGTLNPRTYVLTFSAKEGEIRVQGKYDPARQLSKRPFPIKFAGMKGSPVKFFLHLGEQNFARRVR
jgi:hypothetical protein